MTAVKDRIEGVASQDGALIIRHSRAADTAALARLAQRDSSRLPTGRLIVAEQDGELRAAAPIEGGRPIADPFHRTAAIVRMLELHTGLLRTGA